MNSRNISYLNGNVWISQNEGTKATKNFGLIVKLGQQTPLSISTSLLTFLLFIAIGPMFVGFPLPQFIPFHFLHIYIGLRNEEIKALN
jgi:hypothetical protein